MVRQMHSGWSWLVACGFLVQSLLPACRVDIPPDTDDEMLKAQGLLVGAPAVGDSVNVEEGDAIDWRELSYFERARVTVVYMVGDPAKGHNVKGTIKAFDVSGRQLAAAEVAPGGREYVLQFDVEPNAKYFLAFATTEGAAKYLIEVAAESLDPCARCTADEVCEDGRCVPKPPPGCDPECEEGEECRDGECVVIGCAKGQMLVKRTGRCVDNPCYGFKCGADERCRIVRGKARCEARPIRCPKGEVARGGKCVPEAAEVPTCPTCKPGEKCNAKTGQCEAAKSLTGSILNYFPEGSATILIINRGAEHGVKRGMTGTITGGGAFIVLEVYPFQCRASTKLTRDQLANKRKVTFKF